jgi:urea transporter
MSVCSPISSLSALIGSIISTATAIGLGMDKKTIYNGEHASSAILSTISMAGMFFVL